MLDKISWRRLPKIKVTQLCAAHPKDAVSLAFYRGPSDAEKGESRLPRGGRHMLEELDRE
jgi:hypothetical protein